MTRLGLMASALVLAFGLTPQWGAAQTSTPREESPQDYPDHPGRDQTFYNCTPCHGFKLVAQQGQSRRQWEDTLDFMTQRHNMPKLDDKDRKTVLDYLEVAFPPRTTPGGWQNPFLKR
jgi:hypothetical protein